MSATGRAALVLSHVSKSFASPAGRAPTLALRDVSLSVPQGGFTTLLGPSGCGKTTLLRLADGLLTPDAGSVEVFGAPPRPGPDIGFVFQSYRLLPWASALGNVEFALRSTGLAAPERRARARDWLDRVGMGGFGDAHPGALSGGMRQRVALARALACEPKLLLMDEPFASLDAHSRELMQGELTALWQRTGAAVLFVTHSVDEAITLSDTVVLMSPRPGRVSETLEIDLPRPRRGAAFFGSADYGRMRTHLAEAMREMVMSDPGSEFYGRDR
ncbi:ABC transporter ATP-binding protein [Pelagibacterium montanilacus]|uniref:ABC transporter ATP-binding protein n=1 Tax=Pelagibacterium montanilacus TaxID=2185280 RepID=UPI000F8D610B|nr:ABC transporter ATP-binding protein [Pelagibacterium montanilacus]